MFYTKNLQNRKLNFKQFKQQFSMKNGKIKNRTCTEPLLLD